MSKKVWSLFLQNRLLVLLIPLVAIGIITRFIWLDRFPVGITHDETDIVLSGRYFYQNGTDASGVKFPLTFFKTQLGSGQTNIVPFLLSPYFGNVKQTLSNSRLPFVIISLATTLVLGWVVYLFSKNRVLTVISCLVFLFNPWSFSYSRDVIEAPVSLLFLLLGVAVFFDNQAKRIFWAIPVFLFSAFVYWGAMPIVILCVISLTIYHYLLSPHTKLSKIYHLIFALTFLILSVSYIMVGVLLPDSTFSSRKAQLGISNDQDLIVQVDKRRQQSIQNPFTSIYINKLSISFTDLSKKYIDVFSPDLLFSIGDNMATYRFGQFGLFYIFEIFLLVLGVVTASVYYRKLGILLGILALFAPISSVLNNLETSYYFRSFLLLPLFVMCISLGIWLIISRTRGICTGIVSMLFILVYLVSFGSFLIFYYFQYPVTEQESHFLSERVVSKYVSLVDNSISVNIVTRVPTEVYREISFFNNFETKPFAKSNFIQVKNISISNECPLRPQDAIYLIQDGFNCLGLPNNHLVIENQKDSGTLYRIYNDPICSVNSLTAWRRFNLISDYDIETMNKTAFCNRWLNKQ